MAAHDNSKLDHDSHLLLDQPLLRLPFELLRKNFRSAHWELERDGAFVRNLLKETATAAVGGSSSSSNSDGPPATADVLKNLDTMIGRMRAVKRRLGGFADEERRLQAHETARVRHLADLYEIHGVEDVKYEAWSRVRLDRMLVDYLLRQGYGASARLLAEDRGIEELVDVETFGQVARVRESLMGGSVTEALAWCTAGDTKKELRKMDSNLEFMLRYQQYIELVRDYTPAKLNEAIKHAQKFLHPYRTTHAHEVRQACGLLAVPPYRASAYPAYAALYSPARWHDLADLFVATHNKLLSLPSVPALHMVLGIGLSALKTPACHSAAAQQTVPTSASSSSSSANNPAHNHNSSTGTGGGGSGAGLAMMSLQRNHLCPICSRELNALARAVPYAHHSKSHVEPDLLLLPNWRAYGRERLEEYARKSGLLAGQVKDLRTGEVFGEERLRRVYIT